MSYSPTLLPELIAAINHTINQNAEEVTALDQAIGDGDHIFNLQRGLQALMTERDKLADMDWLSAWQRIGMILMSTVGGASGSLLGTLFVNMSKAGRDKTLNAQTFADCFKAGVENMKLRGRSDVGEKTMLDVLVPVSDYLLTHADQDLTKVLAGIPAVAMAGVEATRNMKATKGRASFLEERTIGHIDAGAKTSQLIICTLVEQLTLAN